MVKIAKPRLTSEQAGTLFLEQLPAMSHKELRQHWRELFDREPNTGMRRNHMIPILAYRAQERAFGGLKESTLRRLRELSLRCCRSPVGAPEPDISRFPSSVHFLLSS